MAEPYNHYRNSAARQHGRPGRELRPRGMTVDLHSQAYSFSEQRTMCRAGRSSAGTPSRP
jgi:hypothetical protein